MWWCTPVVIMYLVEGLLISRNVTQHCADVIHGNVKKWHLASPSFFLEDGKQKRTKWHRWSELMFGDRKTQCDSSPSEQCGGPNTTVRHCPVTPQTNLSAEMGEGDWVLSWPAAPATAWPVAEGPQLICLRGRRSVILPGRCRKSDSAEAEKPFWSTCEGFENRRLLLCRRAHVSCSVLSDNWIIAEPL